MASKIFFKKLKINEAFKIIFFRKIKLKEEIFYKKMRIFNVNFDEFYFNIY